MYGRTPYPEIKDKVWVEGRDGANGAILMVDRTVEPIEFVVYFHDGKGRESYTRDELGHWTDQLGGYWRVEK